MATGRTLITAALVEIGAISAEETPEAADMNTALAILNRMWGGWNADLGTVYAETLDSLTLVVDQASYTIGSGANFNVARPVQIIAAQLRYATNVDVPIEIITFDKYQEIGNKLSGADIVMFLAYNATFPNGTIYLWPVPTVAYSIRLTSKKALAAFDLSTTLSLPPGYEDAIVYNLAPRLAPGWGKAVSQTTYDLATETKSILHRANTVIEEMEPDSRVPGLGRNRKWSWRLG